MAMLSFHLDLGSKRKKKSDLSWKLKANVMEKALSLLSMQ